MTEHNHMTRDIKPRGQCPGCDAYHVSEMTPDDAIRAVWDIADNDQCDGVTWSAASDQWWRVTATCLHGRYAGTSHGPNDVSTAFKRVVDKFREGHDPFPKGRPDVGKPAD
jgi:hypothetical protein